MNALFQQKVKIKPAHHMLIPFVVNVYFADYTLVYFTAGDSGIYIYTLIDLGKAPFDDEAVGANFYDAIDVAQIGLDMMNKKSNSKMSRASGKKHAKIKKRVKGMIDVAMTQRIDNSSGHAISRRVSGDIARATKRSKPVDVKLPRNRRLKGSKSKSKGSKRQQSRAAKDDGDDAKIGNESNREIVKWFKLLIKQLKFYVDVKTGKDKLIYSYKVNSIRKALEIIKKVKFRIESGEQLREFKGIGDGTIARIDEILETCGLLEVNDADISGKHLDYVEELMKIFGIGRVRAYELYTKHGIKSIDDLKSAIREGDIELPENILKGIDYVNKIKTDIPRQEVDEISSALIRTGIGLDSEMDVRVCGSFRREKKTSNDIDVVISHPDIVTKDQAEGSDLMKRFIGELKGSGFIVDSLTSLDVPTKYMGICRLDKGHEMRRIDIRYIPQESYYTAILYFTGSRNFNKRMRSVALSMGYTLNEYRLLSDKGKPMKVESEKDVFDHLNMEYMVPKDRV